MGLISVGGGWHTPWGVEIFKNRDRPQGGRLPRWIPNQVGNDIGTLKTIKKER